MRVILFNSLPLQCLYLDNREKIFLHLRPRITVAHKNMGYVPFGLPPPRNARPRSPKYQTPIIGVNPTTIQPSWSLLLCVSDNRFVSQCWDTAQRRIGDTPNGEIAFEIAREHCGFSTASSIGIRRAIVKLFCLCNRVLIFTPIPLKQYDCY